jgi:hypothetical protein
MSFFFWDSQMGVPKLGLLLSQNFGCLYLSQIKSFFENVRKIFYSFQKIFPIGAHLAPIFKGFMVESQISNLTLAPSFDHNSCKLGLNEQFKVTLSIYASRNLLMVSWGPNLVLVCLSNQGSKHSQLLHECNSQSGSALGSYWVPSLAFSPIFESVFHT